MTASPSRTIGCLVGALLGIASPGNELPNDASRRHADAAARGLIEEVVTTATKKGAAESAQDVAVAIAVMGEQALAERHVTDLEDLGHAMPNVALDGIGTGKGIANFSIRGQGIAGSIPSIDPTVGVFVDGMYLGINYAVIMDMLDLEAVEVLRGPQGLLFGRNVTGGAILLRSRRPSGQSSAAGSMRLETGPEWRLTGSVERALVEGALDMRLSGSYRDDAGWFDNGPPLGGAHGEDTSWVVRPVFTWRPAEDLDVTLIHERGNADAHGPATQNRKRFDGFDIAIDEPGHADIHWQHVVVEANRSVQQGRGRITNVFGWREMGHEALSDIDGTVDPVFHFRADVTQEQVSNELRYAHVLDGGSEVTTGAYFFRQEIINRERRLLRNVWGDPYGGDQDHVTGGVFVNVDWALGAYWMMTTGARYTYERKDVQVATAGQSGCVVGTRHCRFDFADDRAWRNVTPKLGLQRWLAEETLAYAHYTKGFRSGGYNLRSTSPLASPGPFDEEGQDSVEAGLKSELADGHVRLNLAAFHNKVRGMQRQVTRVDVASGGVQITANTADATIRGLEAETVLALGPATTLSGFVGYTRGRYDHVRYDLDGDGSTIGDDRLRLPRLAELTWGVETAFVRNVGERGQVTARLALTHRDDSVSTDDNTGRLKGGELLDASIGYSPTDDLKLTLYGRNLLSEPFWVTDLDLSVLVNSTFSPLREGRTIGLELRGVF